MSYMWDAAAAWAAGFQVVRLWPHGKNPLDKEFQHPEKRMTPEQALAAWSASEWHQTMNLGVIPLSGGCVVVDCDGAEAIEWFEREYADCLDTLQVQSTREATGRHYWYDVTGVENWRRARWSSKLGGRPEKDIDVKARGFALVPPSTNGLHSYEFVTHRAPAPMPARLVAAATSGPGEGGPRLEAGETRATVLAWLGPEAAGEFDLSWYREIAGARDERKFLIRRALEEGVPGEVVRAAAAECGRGEYADEWALYWAERRMA